MHPSFPSSLGELNETLLGLQSRFGDDWGQITWNLSALPPKRDWSSKGVDGPTEREQI